MSASLSGVFSLQEFTDVGGPLVSGQLYTYISGTTTLKIAFTDAAGAVPQTYTNDGLGGQYIALNARGELPAPLFLTAGAYDIALKRADGTTVWTRQAIGTSDVANSIAAAFATTAGAGLSGYSPTLVYTGGTVGDRLNQELTTTGFASLQAAVTAAAGKTLRILGAWTVTTAVAVLSSTTLIVDASASVTTATPDIHIFDASGTSNVHIQGFGKIFSTATTGTMSHIGLINFTGATNCDASGLELAGFQWAGVLIGTGSVNCWAYSCRIHDYAAGVQDCAAVQILDGALNCGVKGGYATNSGYHGVNVQETGGGLVPKGTLIEGYKITTTKVYGINCYNKTTPNVDQNTTIRDCDITDVQGGAPYNTSGGAGIYIQSAGNVKVFGGTISYCCWGTSDNSLTPAGIGVSLSSANSTPATIEGVTFLNMGFSTLGVQNPNLVQISAISVNSGQSGANIGPCIVHQLLANTAGAFTFTGYYLNANSNVAITSPTISIVSTALNSSGIFIFANMLNLSNITISGGSINGGDFAQIRVDQNGGFHVNLSGISNIILSGGSANCIPLIITQGASLNVSGVTASATTQAALALSNATNCKFSNSSFTSTGTSAITTSGACTASIIEETVSFGADSKMSNAGTGCTVKTRGTAAPVAGTWGALDMRINTVVGTGNFMAFGCSAPGAPGTWHNGAAWA